MLRTIEFSLIIAIFSAVLAFGGTEPFYFSISQILLLGSGIVLALGYGSPQLGKPKLPVAVPLALVGLVLLQLVPLSQTISLDPNATRTHLLLLLTYLAAFYLTIAVSQEEQRKKRLIYALIGLGAFEAFYGLIQYLTSWQKIFGYTKVFNLEDATGTYINRNHFAGFLEMILPFALVLAFYQLGWFREAGPSSRNSLARETLQKFSFWTFLAVLVVVVLVFSRSRMGILAALVSILAMGCVALASTQAKKYGLALVILFLFVASLITVWIGPEPVVARFETLEQEYAGGQPDRWDIWRDAVRLVRNHTWVGSGLGTFPAAYTSVQTTFLNMFVNHAHNDYLEVASDLGLLGGFLLFGSIAYLLFQLIRRYQFLRGHNRAIALACVGGICAILWHSVADFNLYIPGNALLFSCVLGLGFRSLREQGKEERLGTDEHS